MAESENPYRAGLIIGGVLGIVVGAFTYFSNVPDPASLYGDEGSESGQLIGIGLTAAGIQLVVLWVAVSAILWGSQ